MILESGLPYCNKKKVSKKNGISTLSLAEEKKMNPPNILR